MCRERVSQWGFRPRNVGVGTLYRFLGLFLVTCIFFCKTSSAQLSAGDIAFVQYNADGTDDFAFVCLIDIPGSEEIKFTDNGWKSDDTWRTGEGIITWTAPGGGVTCGTVVTIDNTAAASVGSVVEAGSLSFVASGDQIIAYQGASTMIAAVNNEGAAVWQASATGTGNSDIPTGLTNTTDCIALTEIDNAKYTGTTSGTKAALLAAINTDANWSGSNTVNQTFSGSFTVTTCGVSGTSIVEIGSGAEPATISSIDDTQGEAVLNFDFKVTDDGATPGTDSDPLKINQIVISQSTDDDITSFTSVLDGALLTDGTNTQTANITINATDITISSIDIANLGLIADNASKTYTLKIWMKAGLAASTIDGDNFAWLVNRGSFTVEGSGSSAFLTGDGTDVESGVNNEVDVVATKLLFVQQPSNTNTSATMSPDPTAEATDVNGNRDLDYTAPGVSITSTGTMTGGPVSGTWSNGLATFANLVHTVGQTSRTITASSGSLTDGTSSTFDIIDFPTTWINEFHYDNDGVDADEKVEIVIDDAGSYTLSDFRVDLYNGSGGVTYANQTLDNFVVGATAGTATIYTWAPTSLQNSMEGIALSYSGTVIQFLSYEGSFAATDGPANGVTSTDIGVSESGTSPVGHSLQLSGTGCQYSDFTWQGSAANTMGAENNSQTICAPTNDADSESSTPGTQVAAGNISSLDDTPGEAVDVFKFDIDDLGSPGDALVTKVTNIRIKPHSSNTADWTDHIQGVKLDNGGAVTIGAPTITDTYIDIPITAGNLDITNGASSTITLSLYLNTSNIVDGAILSFMIDVDAHGWTADGAGSDFNSTFSGGDFNSNDFTITVIATKLLFVQQPTDAIISSAMTPDVTVEATDANGNRDLDFGTDIRITSSGTLSGTPIDVTADQGLATFTGLIHTVAGTGLTLNAERASTTDWDETSGTFDIIVQCMPDLILSEYIEGSSNNKYLEIYNGTGVSVDLTDYDIVHYNNGSATVTYTLDLGTSSIADGDVFVIEDDAEGLGVSADLSTSSNVMGFTGDDAIALRNGGTNIDVIGKIGEDPGTEWGSGNQSTNNNTIRRNASISIGDNDGSDAFDPNPDWDGFALDIVAGLGAHTASCSNTLATGGITGSPFCVTASATASVSVPFTSTGTFNAPNIYTAQLSNSTGSFAAPTNIGTLASTANSGTVSATIPAGTASGTAYRIRVVADDPSTTGIANVIDLEIVLGPTNVTSVSATGGDTQVAVNWTNPSTCFDEILVVGFEGGSVTSSPSGDGSAYTANTLFTNGTDIGTNEYVVYKGSGTNVIITGLTNGTNYCFKIFTRKGTTWSGGAESCDIPAVTTTLIGGDFAILGIDANHAGACGGGAGDDEISFVCFKDIVIGTILEFTDNGWQRENTSQWGNTEGTIRLTRTGGTISAGIVMTLSVDASKSNAAAGRYTIVEPAGGWSFAEINFTDDFNMNSGGDQIYFMQGGTWDGGTKNCDPIGSNPGAGSKACHNATYTGGDVLFGFSTTGGWIDFGSSTQKSGLISGQDCFSMAPTSSTDFAKYTGDLSAATQREWISRINSTANWTSYTRCQDYRKGTEPDYVGGMTLTIDVGGFTDGQWLGSSSTDWFDCKNWESLSVPVATTDVTLPAAGVTFEPEIASAGALTNDLDMEGTRILTINGTGTLTISGNYTNNAALDHTAGTVTFDGAGAQALGGTATSTFQNLTILNADATGVTLGADVNVNGLLTLTDGYLLTSSTNILTLNDGATATSGSAASFVDGPMNKIGDDAFIFPTGDGSSWARIGISDPGTDVTTAYQTEYFASAHTSSTVTGVLNNVSTKEYWTLDQNVTTDDVKVKLYWESDVFSGIDDCDGSPDDLRVAHWNGTAWEVNIDAVVITGTCTAGPDQGTVETNSPQTVYSPFTFASKASGLNPLGAVLPIELLYFDAAYNSATKAVDLVWGTASETNNEFFTVERSQNGHDFQTILTIPGAGTSNGLIEYENVDHFPESDLNYYRLKQTDYDGQFEYSEIVAVNVLEVEHLKIWPNPAKDFVEVSFGTEVMSSVEDMRSCMVKIYNAQGQLLYTRDHSSDLSMLKIDVSKLNAGLYIVAVSLDGQTFQVKFNK